MENTPSKNHQIAITEGYVSILANVVLFGLKMWAGLVSSSIALKADAWHTLSDSISSVIVIVAAKVSQKPADKAHPFGHGRAGLIASLFIGFFLVVIGFEFAKEGVLKLVHREPAHFGILAIVVTVISIVVKEGMAQYAYWGYRKTGEESLRADGWHHRSDALSSVVVLAGILLGKKLWWADGALSFAIAGLLGYAAYEIISSAVNILLGHRPSKKLEDQITQICDEFIGPEAHLHHLHVHHYGNHTEVTFHIQLDGHQELNEVHNKVTQLVLQIREKLNIESTIHVDPIGTPY